VAVENIQKVFHFISEAQYKAQHP